MSLIVLHWIVKPNADVEKIQINLVKNILKSTLINDIYYLWAFFCTDNVVQFPDELCLLKRILIKPAQREETIRKAVYTTRLGFSPNWPNSNFSTHSRVKGCLICDLKRCFVSRFYVACGWFSSSNSPICVRSYFPNLTFSALFPREIPKCI